MYDPLWIQNTEFHQKVTSFNLYISKNISETIIWEINNHFGIPYMQQSLRVEIIMSTVLGGWIMKWLHSDPHPVKVGVEWTDICGGAHPLAECQRRMQGSVGPLALNTHTHQLLLTTHTTLRVSMAAIAVSQSEVAWCFLRLQTERKFKSKCQQ